MNTRMQYTFGERFSVLYLVTASEEEIQSKAMDICYEQTVELPEDLIEAGLIRDQIVGRIEEILPLNADQYHVTISYACEDAGDELTQFLNTLFGNISIKPGIRVERFDLPESMLNLYRGPRYGRQGLRDFLGVPQRPLLCSALKPLGFSAKELAETAYQFALGGIDIIKDDHGLADQVFAPFEERVKACATAVHEANQKTGFHSVYMPNITARANQVVSRAYRAKELGAEAFMVCPGLVGFDTMRQIADDDQLGLPVISHPAFAGSFVTCPGNGFSHFAYYGQLTRLAGADAVIYPNWGGRFSFSREECISIVDGTQTPMGHLKSIFPTPGGGMTMQRVPEMLDVYKQDLIFLVGGGLHRLSPDLAANSRYFREMVEGMK